MGGTRVEERDTSIAISSGSTMNILMGGEGGAVNSNGASDEIRTLFLRGGGLMGGAGLHSEHTNALVV